MKIGMYLPSAILVGTALLFTGLAVWTDAGWKCTTLTTPFGEKAEKTSGLAESAKWTTRPRPVLQAVSIMLATHLLGVVLFCVLSSRMVCTSLT